MLFGLGAVLVVLTGLSAFHAMSAARAAIDGKRALLRSEQLIGRGELGSVRAELTSAKAKFGVARREIDTAVRFLPFVRYVPVVRSQVEGAEALAAAGTVLADAGVSLADAAEAVVEPEEDVSLTDAIDHLREIRGLLAEGLSSIDAASTTLAPFEDAFLPGPVGAARADFESRLGGIRRKAAGAEEGLGALITFVGGDGPRTYLYLSQNPDEVRPTGGFIGTYGVVSADGGQLSIDRFEAIGEWSHGRPEAHATEEEEGPPFSYDPRLPMRLGNANTIPHWPDVAQLAARMWERGGEEPVDGVISSTPAFLARVLDVLGPVDVPEYGERVTADNVVERLDFYTHELRAELGRDRKDFVAAVAQEVMGQLIQARTSKWVPLSRAVAQSFEAREAMAWSTDPEVAEVLAEREWDGALPEVAGDFVYPAEFQYAAKNGRTLRRVYDHRVRIRADGSSTVTTTATIINPEPADDYGNRPEVISYITMYGPQGSTAGAGSDPLGITEPTIAGHPARGWFRPITPESQTTLTVQWEVPQLLRVLPGGRLAYTLRWMALPDHTGDVLRLDVQLPDGWRWVDEAPPPEIDLDDDVDGSWELEQG